MAKYHIPGYRAYKNGALEGRIGTPIWRGRGDGAAATFIQPLSSRHYGDNRRHSTETIFQPPQCRCQPLLSSKADGMAERHVRSARRRDEK